MLQRCVAQAAWPQLHLPLADWLDFAVLSQ